MENEKETPFLQRLAVEEAILGDKIYSLNKVLNADGFAEKVGAYQFELLGLQHTARIMYRRILNMRISELTKL
jgi:hypothetical protein